MTRIRSLWFSAALAMGAAAPALAQEASPQATTSVWARVLFGEDGKLREAVLLDEDRYPKAFAENLKARISKASIKAPIVEGKPATMRTGMELRFAAVATPEGQATKIVGMSMSPIPLKRDFDIQQADSADAWTGEVSATCVVSPEGQCGPVEVAAAPNMPEQVRRYAKTTVERLRFEPQEVGGKPVEGDFTFRAVITKGAPTRPDFRDPRRVF